MALCLHVVLLSGQSAALRVLPEISVADLKWLALEFDFFGFRLFVSRCLEKVSVHFLPDY